jgi:hypothetical protein
VAFSALTRQVREKMAGEKAGKEKKNDREERVRSLANFSQDVLSQTAEARA